MVSPAALTFPSVKFPTISATNSSAAVSTAPPTSICCNILLETFDDPIKKRGLNLSLFGGYSSFGTSAVRSHRISSIQTPEVAWEEPDGGSGSEYDEEDDGEEEDNLDFESDWEKEVDVREGLATTVVADNPIVNLYDEQLRIEVEMLLDPEELAILQQNEGPDIGKISTVKFCKQFFMDVFPFPEKWSPLHTLALSGQIPHMDKLFEHGVDINSVDKDGFTALHTAIIGKKEAVISHLLRKGANPHIRDQDGATPLHYAVQVGAVQTVKLLIKYKVDINAEDDEGWTPLHIAVQSRNRDIAKILLVNGADKTRRNKDGKTPLDLSLCYGKEFKSYDLAKLLKVVPANRDF
ncbi:Ankyrin repeat [Dillenia turbinata]|uniref:Ankyrin repeat n=1 Tax=Dillenia turbinata TaxID=194707 RepID=A0AAN8Z6F7_9MAGN